MFWKLRISPSLVLIKNTIQPIDQMAEILNEAFFPGIFSVSSMKCAAWLVETSCMYNKHVSKYAAFATSYEQQISVHARRLNRKRRRWRPSDQKAKNLRQWRACSVASY